MKWQMSSDTLGTVLGLLYMILCKIPTRGFRNPWK